MRSIIKKGMAVILFCVSVFVVLHEDESSEAQFAEDAVLQENYMSAENTINSFKNLTTYDLLKGAAYIGQVYDGYSSVKNTVGYMADAFNILHIENCKINATNTIKAEREEVRREYLTSKKAAKAVNSQPVYVNTQYDVASDGLTPSAGVNYYGEQKETYYNLNMNRVVDNAQSKGLEGDYWVRDDGVKMFGDYVIVAANQEVHPYGSTVDTSLGTGIVLDTGGFAYNNPTQVDIATDW